MTEIQRFTHAEKFADTVSDVILIPLGTGRNLVMMSGVAAELPEGTWLQADMAAVSPDRQVAFVWNRIVELLAMHGGTIADIVKLTIYVTDTRYLIEPVATFLKATFAGGPLPTATGVAVSGLAWPEMMLEIDVTAVI